MPLYSNGISKTLLVEEKSWMYIFLKATAYYSSTLTSCDIKWIQTIFEPQLERTIAIKK